MNYQFVSHVIQETETSEASEPWGMFVVIAADGIIMAFVTAFFQCQVGKFAPIDRCAYLRASG